MRNLLLILFLFSTFFLQGQKPGTWYFTSEGNLCSEFEGSVKLVLKEAERVVRLTSGKWIPASIKNKSIKLHFTMPVSFILQ